METGFALPVDAQRDRGVHVARLEVADRLEDRGSPSVMTLTLLP
jgi:hypothetical protein